MEFDIPELASTKSAKISSGSSISLVELFIAEQMGSFEMREREGDGSVSSWRQMWRRALGAFTRRAYDVPDDSESIAGTGNATYYPGL